MTRLASFALAVSALALTAAMPARADDFSPAQRGAIEKIIKDYLLEHPEVLQDAIGQRELADVVQQPCRMDEVLFSLIAAQLPG